MKNIYLIGMPSSGKSTLGKELARNLSYTFTDMDKLIETREQKTISEIFICSSPSGKLNNPIAVFEDSFIAAFAISLEKL